MTQAEINKINDIVEAMSNEEKVVVVKNIPTELLQNEITRRLNRDRELRELITNLVNSMEKY